MTLGLHGPPTSECADGCRLTHFRDDTCKPGVCYARLIPTKYWDASQETWHPTPEEDCHE